MTTPLSLPLNCPWLSIENSVIQFDFNMFKRKYSENVKLRKCVQEFGEWIISSDGSILYCKLCEIKVSPKNHFNMQQFCDV